jgi:hypothetical protein
MRLFHVQESDPQKELGFHQEQIAWTPHHPPVKSIIRKDAVTFFFKHELILAISLLSLISYNVFNLVDYTFHFAG